ncbi:hypothetical protein [Coleofasciculus chthonoplastes]|uniref:hypothetical protein n=1 Tax=Coleofasciculus chthonoplastes TaxID=64178 RepID=UPI0033004778
MRSLEQGDAIGLNRVVLLIKPSGSPLHEDYRGLGFGIRHGLNVCFPPILLYPDLKTRSHIHSTPITEGAIARTGRRDRIKSSRVVN